MIKKLAAHIGEYKLPSFLTPVCMILEVIMEMIIPLLMASIIDKGVNMGDMGHVARVGAVMLAATLLSLAAGIGGAHFGAVASAGFAKNLRQAMFSRIQEYSFSNIDKYSTAGLVTRLTTDVTNVQNAYMMILRMCFRAPVTMVVALFMAFSINARLSSIFLVVLVFLGVCLAFIMSRAFPLFSQVFKKYDALNSSVQENVNAIRVVKAYVREEYENEKFRIASSNLKNLFVKAEKMVVLNMPLMQFCSYGCILILSYMGAQFIVAGDMTTGNLTSMLSYVMNILMSMMMLSMVFVMITMSKAAAERIVEVLEEQPTIADGAENVMEVKDGSIVFDHVNFAYKKDGNMVLKDICLNIPAGATVGILGGTGSAKSSLVNLIPRLYDVTEGSVKVGGLDVRKYNIEALRESVAVVLQKNVLFSGTVNDNIRWGKEDATQEEIQEVCKLACADEFIQTFPDKYETHIEQGGTNVSGGQKQRLCIARALIKRPKVLILDDSTSAVDTATDARIREAFAKKIPGTTKLIIAQRISSVQDSDIIVVLDDGKINGVGTHEELMANNAIYRDVYESQMKGSEE